MLVASVVLAVSRLGLELGSAGPMDAQAKPILWCLAVPRSENAWAQFLSGAPEVIGFAAGLVIEAAIVCVLWDRFAGWREHRQAAGGGPLS
jgi:hypothetical protein